MNVFEGRKLVIATKHKKEQIMSPLLSKNLGVSPFVPLELDTDILGTFSGEIERKLDPLSTLRKKCEMAMEISGVDLGTGSEGSFGQHPGIPFIAANEELVMLIDKKNELEIIGKKLSVETNFNGSVCRTERELIDFAEKSNFPSHALILRNRKSDNGKIFKGISNLEDLLKNFWLLKDLYGEAFAETDMRANFNPTRMKVIGEATAAMIVKANTFCKSCGTPGFGISDIRTGLKCKQCGMPTKSIATYLYSCTKCNYMEEHPNPTKLFEEPMFCDFCNP